MNDPIKLNTPVLQDIIAKANPIFFIIHGLATCISWYLLLINLLRLSHVEMIATSFQSLEDTSSLIHLTTMTIISIVQLFIYFALAWASIRSFFRLLYFSHLELKGGQLILKSIFRTKTIPLQHIQQVIQKPYTIPNLPRWLLLPGIIEFYEGKLLIIKGAKFNIQFTSLHYRNYFKVLQQLTLQTRQANPNLLQKNLELLQLSYLQMRNQEQNYRLLAFTLFLILFLCLPALLLL